ncbi:hypothetical protein ABZX51_002478 [Aspergillus tubingensis]
MTFEPWGPNSATPAIFTVQLVLLKRCSTEYSAGIMANMELDDFGVCFFLSSLFYLGLIYYTLIIPSKAFTQVFTTAVAITVSGTQLPSEQWGSFWTWRFVFVSFIAFYLPTCPLTTYDRMDIVTF